MFEFLRKGRQASPLGKDGFTLLGGTMSALAEDTKTSREMQQRAISWMGTTVSALLFGTLVFYSAHTTASYWLVTAVLGMGAPVTATAASAVFLGELARQGRAAMVRRSLELWAQEEPSLYIGTNKPISPLLGERLYGSLSKSSVTAGYGVDVYYMAILAVFGAGVSVGPLVASLITWGAPEGIAAAGQVLPHSLITGLIILIFWSVVTFVQARTVQQMAKEAVPLHAIP